MFRAGAALKGGTAGTAAPQCHDALRHNVNVQLCHGVGQPVEPLQHAVVDQCRREIGHGQSALGVQRNQPVDAVLEFAHVAGPLVSLQSLLQLGTRLHSRFSQEVLQQQGNVFLPMA